MVLLGLINDYVYLVQLFNFLAFYYLFLVAITVQVYLPYQQLGDSKIQLKTLVKAVDQNPLSTLILDVNFNITKANKAFTDAYNFKLEDFKDKDVNYLQEFHEAASRVAEIKTSLAQELSWRSEVRVRNNLGQELVEEEQIFAITNAKGGVISYLVICENLTESKELQAKLESLTNHDQLTNLPNRKLLEEYFDRTVKNPNKYALLWLDLDNFREVNDALGFRVGDLILRQVAYRLQSELASQEVITRISGDDFVILTPFKSQTAVSLRVRQYLDILAEPLVLPLQTISLTASVGIAIYPADAENLNDLLQKAEISKYKAKSQGRNSYQFYEVQMQEKASIRLAQSNALKNAIANKELTLVYQPQICLQTKRMVGVEALLRWHSQE